MCLTGLTNILGYYKVQRVPLLIISQFVSAFITVPRFDCLFFFALAGLMSYMFNILVTSHPQIHQSKLIHMHMWATLLYFHFSRQVQSALICTPNLFTIPSLKLDSKYTLYLIQQRRLLLPMNRIHGGQAGIYQYRRRLIRGEVLCCCDVGNLLIPLNQPI